MEKNIFKTIQAGRAASEKLEEMKKQGIPCPAEERKALKRLVRLGEEARDSFVRENEGLVRKVVNHVWADPQLREDLLQVGRMALCKAAVSYDPSRGAAFSTHAWKIILRDVTRELPGSAFVLKISEEIMNNIRTVERARAKLEFNMADGSATVAEIAELTGLSEEKVTAALEIAPMVKYGKSFDADDGDDDTGRTALRDTIPAEKSCEPEYAMLAAEKIHTVREAVKKLPRKEQEVVRFLFGFDNGKPLSLGEIAKLKGYSKTTAHNIKTRALEILRQSAALRDCYMAS